MGWEVVARDQYLWRRGGRYYVRRRVPTHLVPFVEKEHLTRSLQTSDYKEAKKRADIENAKIRLAFDKAEATLVAMQDQTPAEIDSLSFDEIEALVSEWFDRSKQDVLENWSFRAPGFTDAGEDMEAMKDEALAEVEDRLRREVGGAGPADLSAARSIAHGLLVSQGFTPRPRQSGRTGKIEHVTSPSVEVDERSEHFQHLIAHVREAQSELLRYHRSVLRGVDLDEPSVSMQSRGLTLNQLVEAFLDDPRRSGISEKRRTDYEMVFKILREVWGGQKRVRDLVREDFREVSRLIRSIPKHSTKIFPGIAFAEAARRAEENELPKLNPKTVTTHLQKVSTLFRWAENEDYVERNLARGLADPGAGTHSEDDRHPFSIEELQKIFAAPLFSGCIDDPRNHARPGPNRPKRARFWVPLIGLFHGMRLNEICQLQLDQIKTERGIWHFDVHASDGGQRLKTSQSKRRIPLHPEILRIGFLNYLSKLRECGEVQLFPELTLDGRGLDSHFKCNT